MAFWGVKLKPKKALFVTDDDIEGRKLHITRATLGLHPEIQDEPPQRTIVKCKSQDGSAIFVASLMAGSRESCSLDLCFEEPVAFSVTGPIAVHLSGFTVDDDDDDEFDDDDESDEDYMDGEGFIVNDEDDDEEEDEEEAFGQPAGRSSVKIEEIAPSEVKASVETPKELGKDASEDEDGLPVKRKAADAETSNKKAKTSGEGTPAAAAAEAASPGETLSAKKKKKKGKKKAKGDGEEQPEGNGTESEKSPAKPKGKVKRRFPNGLEIEDVKMGKPDGKMAKAGKKGLTK